MKAWQEQARSVVAAGEDRDKALLDLGWEVMQWPLQLVLPANRLLSSASKQRENCLFCFLDWWH